MFSALCVWRFFSANILFFRFAERIFFCMSHIEIWIIVTLYWAWHWSRRNRCALQPSRRVYHKSRTLFFLCIIIFFKFQNEWGEKSIYFPEKKGKHLSNKKGKWDGGDSKWCCVYDILIYHLFTSSPVHLRSVSTHTAFLSLESFGLNLRFFLSIELRCC